MEFALHIIRGFSCPCGLSWFVQYLAIHPLHQGLSEPFGIFTFTLRATGAFAMVYWGSLTAAPFQECLASRIPHQQSRSFCHITFLMTHVMYQLGFGNTQVRCCSGREWAEPSNPRTPYPRTLFKVGSDIKLRLRRKREKGRFMTNST